MAALQKFKEQGWYLSEDGLRSISDDGRITDFRELEKRALDTDLRDISKGGALATDNFKPSKLEIAAGGVVLQVQSVRNVSAPKCNEESKAAPRMLQVDFSDGQHVCSGLEMEPVPALSVNTAPGTKVLLRGAVRVAQGFLMLAPANVSVPGGLVPLMHERWEHGRALAKYAKGIRPAAGPNGPPPWIPFGQRSVQQLHLSKDTAFRSLATADKERDESKENAEFTAMRAEAIAAAVRVKSKKVFGGGGRTMVDHNVKKICDKGFTEEEAKMALKYNRDNLEKAMGNLKRDRAGVDRNGTADSVGGGGGGRGGRGGGRDRRGGPREMEDLDGAKPSAKVSLFDFLEDKIPQVTESVPTAYTSSASAVTSASAYVRPSFPAKPTYNPSNSHSNYNATNNHHHIQQQQSQHHHQSHNTRDENHNNPFNRKHDDNPFRKPTATTNGGRSGPPSAAPPAENGHAAGPRHVPVSSTKRGGAGGSVAPPPAPPKANPAPNRGQTHAQGERPPKSEPRPSAASSNQNSTAASSVAASSHSSSSTSTSSNSNTNTTSTTSSKPVSASNPFSLENRAKFQNNMSASFANRTKRDQPPAAPSATKPPPSTPAPQQQQQHNHSSSSSSSSAQPPANSARNRSQARKHDEPKPASAHSARATHNATPAQQHSETRPIGGGGRAADQRAARKPLTAPTSNGVSGTAAPAAAAAASTSNNATSYNAAAKYQQNAPKLTKGGLLATGAAAQAPVRDKPVAVVAATATTPAAPAPLSTNPFLKALDRRPAANKNAANAAATSRATTSPASLDKSPPMAQLVKATAALKVATVSVPPTAQPPKSARPSGRSGKPSKTTGKADSLDAVFPNGFEFNPNRIMGFANRETNEVAQNVMRANSLEISSQQRKGQEHTATPVATTPMPERFAATGPPMSQRSAVKVTAVEAQPQHQKQPPKQQHQPQQQQQTQQLQPQPNQQQPQPVQPDQTYMQPTYSIMPLPQQQQQQPVFGFQPFNRPLNRHDVCFAKYWEDGRFYNAEITGVCDLTCVVEFLEYGNFEEVLLADCVPINDCNIQLVNQYNAGLSLLSPSHYPHQTPAPTPPLPLAALPPAPPQMHTPPMMVLQHPMAMPVPANGPVSAAMPFYGAVAHQQPLLQTPVPHQQPQHFNATVHYNQQQQQPQLQQQHVVQQPQPQHVQQQLQQQLQQQQHQQIHHHQHQQQQQQQQRLRGERQMYVPPAQRSTK